jgi:hypothetical protein
MGETALILELVRTLFDMPDITRANMSDEEAMLCGNAAYELLSQYLRKLKTGEPPELTAETQEFLRRVEARAFATTAH